MRNLLLFLTGLVYCQVEEDPTPLVVDLKVRGDNEVERNSSVTYRCEWSIDETFGDYDLDEFILYWISADENNHRETLIRWEPSTNVESEKVVYYIDHDLQDRITHESEFNEKYADLVISDVDIPDDDLTILCEIHWGKRVKYEEETFDVYVNALDVVLTEIDNDLEGRITYNNGTEILPQAEKVASCKIENVYPRPSKVNFQVGDETISVGYDDADEDGDDDNDDVTIIENDDGTFDIEANLILEPLGKYHMDEVTCSSQSATVAPILMSDERITLNVTYETDNVNVYLQNANGCDDDQDADDNDDDDCYIKEGDSYTVVCEADGNPPPLIIMSGPDGAQLGEGGVAEAKRSVAIQYITCKATNDFDEDGEVREDADWEQDQATLDVYYLDEPTLSDESPLKIEYLDDEEITCTAAGNPKPEIQWFDDGKVIHDGPTLNLNNVEYNDADTYTCVATNAFGSEDVDIVVEVDGPCVVEIFNKNIASASDQDSEIEANVLLQCRVVGPNCEGSWTSDEENLIDNFGKKITDEPDVVTIELNTPKQADEVVFSCTGKNSRGPVVKTVTIGEEPFCCALNTASLTTGAIVAIVIAIPAILIVVGAAVFFCRKKQESDSDTEGNIVNDHEKEPLAESPERETSPNDEV